MKIRIKLFLADPLRPLSEFIKGNVRILFGDKHLYTTTKMLMVFIAIGSS